MTKGLMISNINLKFKYNDKRSDDFKPEIKIKKYINKRSKRFQFDSVVAKIDSLSERVKSINWSGVEYDFNIERSVVQVYLFIKLFFWLLNMERSVPWVKNSF